MIKAESARAITDSMKPSSAQEIHSPKVNVFDETIKLIDEEISIAAVNRDYIELRRSTFFNEYEVAYGSGSNYQVSDLGQKIISSLIKRGFKVKAKMKSNPHIKVSW